MLNAVNALFNERLMYPTYEIIGGEKIMAPAASVYHSNSIVELAFEFKNYFRQHKNGYVFSDNVDVHFDDNSIYRPDLVVVSKENEKIINWNKAIYGVPDLVVEILSRSTMKKDLTVKKDTYEKFGVKEYWIVDPFRKTVDAYILRDGKFELDEKYICYNEDEFNDLDEDEKAEVKLEISPSIFPEIKINLHDIFDLY